MGAHLEIRTYDLDTQAKVRTAFDSDCEQARYEDGNGSYTGSIGQFFSLSPKRTGSPFGSIDEAETYIADNHQKWDTTAFAVKFYVKNGASAKVKKADEVTRKAYKKLQDTARDTLANIKGRKAPLVSCKGCGSKVNKNYVYVGNGYNVVCPLCKTNIMSNTKKNRIQGLFDKLEKARNNADKIMKAEAKKGDKTAWLVGGLVSS